jgi:hypothetical protein
VSPHGRFLPLLVDKGRSQLRCLLQSTLCLRQVGLEGPFGLCNEGEMGPELRRKLADLEKEYNEIGRESARAFLGPKLKGDYQISTLVRLEIGPESDVRPRQYLLIERWRPKLSPNALPGARRMLSLGRHLSIKRYCLGLTSDSGPIWTRLDGWLRCFRDGTLTLLGEFVA